MSQQVVGIDLGTTNSCIAIYKDGAVRIIETEEGKKTIPSFVFYADDSKILIGETALRRSALLPKNGIYDAKRLIGSTFSDKSVQIHKTIWPFQVVAADNNECEIEIVQDDQRLRIRPEEISATVLTELKRNAERELGEKIENAVITVPAYFRNPQKQATKDAADIAGLRVLKLITEPTAAALAFSFDKNIREKRTVLVYDLGGGTFDVSLIQYNDTDINVIAVSGERNLGGRDFDRNLLNYILNRIQDNKNIKFEGLKKRRTIRRLERECESIKKSLTDCHSAAFELFEFQGIDYVELTITREMFEKLNEDLFEETILIMDRMLKTIKIEKEAIDDILLVGGSTRIPKIREMVKNYFNGKEPITTVNPDEIVAIGAAYQAALLSEDPTQRSCKRYKLQDVAPHSLGIEVAQKESMNVIIEKNSPIPCTVEKKYYTFLDYQKDIKIRIFEGESGHVKDNTFFGEFTIEGITPKPTGDVTVTVKFQLDSNGILKVTAKESSKNKTKDLTIGMTNGRLTNKEKHDIQTGRLSRVLL